MKNLAPLFLLISSICFVVLFSQDESKIIEKNDGYVPMVLIPAGSFMMGSEFGDKNEIPVHKVTITKSFWMSKYEITRGNYYALMENVSTFFLSNKNLPVINVSWYDAIKFCSKLSKKENLEDCYTFINKDKVECDFSKNGYRLPTEAEWEYACRAGTVTECYSGDDISIFDLVAWFRDNSGNKTHEVGQKESNAFGLYDMHGNVWEWCWDGYSIRFYKEGPEIDPKGVNTASNRVIRGGSWYSNLPYCRSAFRAYVVPDLSSDDRGFRIVRNQ